MAQIGQVGHPVRRTGHIGARVRMADGTEKDVYYNGFTWDEIRAATGCASSVSSTSADHQRAAC